ncbi:MAG: hypothetical protein AAGA99_18370 [Actinomycetota bacterium]
MIGLIIGQVTWRKSCQLLAPSMRAASYSSFGTPLSAAMKMIIALPTPQVAMSPKVGVSQGASLSQSGPPIPNTASSRLSQPSCALRKPRQMNSAETNGTIVGRKNIARKNDRPHRCFAVRR